MTEVQKIEKSLNDFTNRVLEITLSAINEKQNELEQVKQVSFWKEKAEEFNN